MEPRGDRVDVCPFALRQLPMFSPARPPSRCSKNSVIRRRRSLSDLPKLASHEIDHDL